MEIWLAVLVFVTLFVLWVVLPTKIKNGKDERDKKD